MGAIRQVGTMFVPRAAAATVFSEGTGVADMPPSVASKTRELKCEGQKNETRAKQ